MQSSDDYMHCTDNLLNKLGMRYVQDFNVFIGSTKLSYRCKTTKSSRNNLKVQSPF